MQAMIPDTLQGALILSAIDFFLSFVIISGIGFVLALFPLMNRVGKTRIESRPKVVHKKPGDPTPRCTSRSSPRRYTRPWRAPIGSSASSRCAAEGDWLTEGRLAHHLSHLPKH